MVQYGTIVSKYRKDYLEKLEPVFFEICNFFLNIGKVELKYFSGWDESESFLQSLVNDLSKDLRYGYTHSGPHRCDVSLMIDDRLAKNVVSRGQLKLLMLCLKLSQVKLINTQNNSVCVLIDDLTAELDLQNKAKLMDYLSRLGCQVFMSTTELSNFGDLSQLENYKVFHVEHGDVCLVK